jgi:hypothetical protein
VAAAARSGSSAAATSSPHGGTPELRTDRGAFISEPLAASTSAATAMISVGVR